MAGKGKKQRIKPGFNRAASHASRGGRSTARHPNHRRQEAQDAARPKRPPTRQRLGRSARMSGQQGQTKQNKAETRRKGIGAAGAPARAQAKRAAKPGPTVSAPLKPNVDRLTAPLGCLGALGRGEVAAQKRGDGRARRVNRRQTAPFAPSGRRLRRNAHRIETAEPSERNRMGRRIGRIRKP